MPSTLSLSLTLETHPPSARGPARGDAPAAARWGFSHRKGQPASALHRRSLHARRGRAARDRLHVCLDGLFSIIHVSTE